MWVVSCHGGGGWCWCGVVSHAALLVGLHSGASLIDVCLNIVPLLPSSSSQTVAGCLLGGYPAGRDW